MALNSFKGWQIDLDPINVYFWVFSGFLLKLGYLDKLSQAPTDINQTMVNMYLGSSNEIQSRA
jgi:hypothetical protein